MTQSLQVLILEDKPRDAKLMAIELERSGYEVVWQRVDCEEDFLSHLRSDLDVILADGSLPQFDAIRAMDLLNERNLNIPLIVVTGSIADERAVEFIKRGAADYLLKDRLARLGQAVANVLDNKKLAEGARRMEEERNRFFHLSMDMLCVGGFDGYFKLLNPAWEGTLGWSAEELISRPYMDFVHPEDRPATRSEELKLMKGEVTRSFENRYRCKDGSYKWLSWQAIPDLTRQLNYASARDMTQQKRAEEELRERDERFRLVAKATNDAVWDLNVATGRVWWNESTHTLFRYHPNDVGKDRIWWEARIAPDDRDRIISSLESAIQSKTEVWSGEYRFRRGDDTYAEVFDRGYILRNSQGDAVRVLGAMVDITSRKRAERQFRDVLESAPDAMIIVNEKGAIVLVNHQTEALFGYRREELLGWPVDNLLPERCRRQHREHRNQFAGDGRLRRMGAGLDLFGLRKDGSEFPVEISLSPMETEEEILTVSAIRDITDNKRLEEQFRQAQKMEAIGRLAGGVAHDFNNVLQVIIGACELLAPALNGKERELAEEAADAATRGAALTRQLLAFSRQQVVQPQIILLNKLISGMEVMLRRLLGEDIELTISSASYLWPILADPGQIEQILLNLCVNARDAMPRGGRITVETRNFDLDQKYVDTRIEARSGPYVQISVSDTGMGMDAVTQRRLFEPFFTTKPTGKGTGLGLATVWGIVKQSGGFIAVYSELGRGSTFKIYLPKSEQGPSLPPPPEPPLPIVGGTETIILTEDEQSVRALARELLKNAGYQVLEASHGAEAIRLFKNHTDPIHLLITDVVMPGMGGRELAETLTEIHPGLKVLYLSGYSDDAVLHHGVLTNEAAFLQKPFGIAALLRKVREVLDR